MLTFYWLALGMPFLVGAFQVVRRHSNTSSAPEHAWRGALLWFVGITGGVWWSGIRLLKSSRGSFDQNALFASSFVLIIALISVAYLIWSMVLFAGVQVVINGALRSPRGELTKVGALGRCFVLAGCVALTAPVVRFLLWESAASVAEGRRASEAVRRKVFVLALEAREVGAIRALAANPETPADILLRIAGLNWGAMDSRGGGVKDLLRRDFRPIRVALLENPSLAAESFRELAQSESDEVLAAVAASPRCPGIELERLSFHDSEFIREGVASNPNTPRPILERLALGDPSDSVREAATLILAGREKPSW